MRTTCLATLGCVAVLGVAADAGRAQEAPPAAQQPPAAKAPSYPGSKACPVDPARSARQVRVKRLSCARADELLLQASDAGGRSPRIGGYTCKRKAGGFFRCTSGKRGLQFLWTP